jgi:hypothetical protein
VESMFIFFLLQCLLILSNRMLKFFLQWNENLFACYLDSSQQFISQHSWKYVGVLDILLLKWKKRFVIYNIPIQNNHSCTSYLISAKVWISYFCICFQILVLVQDLNQYSRKAGWWSEGMKSFSFALFFVWF